MHPIRLVPAIAPREHCTPVSHIAHPLRYISYTQTLSLCAGRAGLQSRPIALLFAIRRGYPSFDQGDTPGRPRSTAGRIVRITFSLASDLAGTGVLGGAAFHLAEACPGTDLMPAAAAGGRTGSAARLRGSCMPVAFRRCSACRRVDALEVRQGVVLESRFRHRPHRSRRQMRAPARSDRPARN